MNFISLIIEGILLLISVIFMYFLFSIGKDLIFKNNYLNENRDAESNNIPMESPKNFINQKIKESFLSYNINKFIGLIFVLFSVLIFFFEANHIHKFTTKNITDPKIILLNEKNNTKDIYKIYKFDKEIDIKK